MSLGHNGMYFRSLTFVACILELAVTPAAAQEPACGMTQFRACHDTNELMLSPGTKVAIADFLGREPGVLLSPPGSRSTAADDAIEVLQGPPDKPVQFPRGRTLFT